MDAIDRGELKMSKLFYGLAALLVLMALAIAPVAADVYQQSSGNQNGANNYQIVSNTNDGTTSYQIASGNQYGGVKGTNAQTVANTNDGNSVQQYAYGNQFGDGNTQSVTNANDASSNVYQYASGAEGAASSSTAGQVGTDNTETVGNYNTYSENSVEQVAVAGQDGINNHQWVINENINSRDSPAVVVVTQMIGTLPTSTGGAGIGAYQTTAASPENTNGNWQVVENTNPEYITVTTPYVPVVIPTPA